MLPCLLWEDCSISIDMEVLLSVFFINGRGFTVQDVEPGAHFLAALHYNAFFLLAFPFVAYYLIKQYIRFVFRKDPLPFFQIGLSAYNGIMLLVLLFWVLRNIPVFPFSLLAP